MARGPSLLGSFRAWDRRVQHLLSPRSEVMLKSAGPGPPSKYRLAILTGQQTTRNQMGKNTIKRRQSHGFAWHWKQTDCWYYTLPGTKKRVPLFDEQGQRIRGKESKEAAEIALARDRVNWNDAASGVPINGGDWLVARVCSEYVQYCDRGMAKGSISRGHRDNSVAWLNDLCKYCGACPLPN